MYQRALYPHQSGCGIRPPGLRWPALSTLQQGGASVWARKAGRWVSCRACWTGEQEAKASGWPLCIRSGCEVPL